MTSTTPPPSELPRRAVTPTIAGWRGGAGPSVLLLHGVGLRAEAWGPVLAALCAHVTVTAVDLPGHGESERLASAEPELASYVDAIADVLVALDEPVVVVGHSMGGMIALELTARHDAKVAGVVAVNTIHDRPPEAAAAVQTRASQIATDTAPNPTSTITRWFGARPTGAEAQMALDCRRWLSQVDPAGYRQAYATFAHAAAPSDELLRALPCPALFVTGADDPNSTPAMSHAMAGLAPRGSAHIIDGARHMLPMTHADTLAQLIVSLTDATS